MYLSHPVRRMRQNPTTDQETTLVVELDGEPALSALRTAVESADGEIIDELPFECWLVRLPEVGVDAVCSPDGVVRVETDATLDRGVDETVEVSETDDGGLESDDGPDGV